MKLFFETAGQGAIFLLMVPIGMLLAFNIDISACAKRTKPLWDVFSMVVCFGTVAISIVLLNDTQLRMYHFLGVLAGSILYNLGIRRVLECFHRHTKTVKVKKMKLRQGKTSHRSNDTNTELIWKDDCRCGGQ